MAEAAITYWDEESSILFVWHGGAYIDFGYAESMDALGTDWVASDVLNVWHLERDVSTLEVSAEGSRRPFRAVLEEFEKLCQSEVRAIMAGVE